jgi:hypothetical protein
VTVAPAVAEKPVAASSATAIPADHMKRVLAFAIMIPFSWQARRRIHFPCWINRDCYSGTLSEGFHKQLRRMRHVIPDPPGCPAA